MGTLGRPHKKMNNAAENRRKKALLIVNPCAGKNRTRSDLGEIINAFPDAFLTSPSNTPPARATQ